MALLNYWKKIILHIIITVGTQKHLAFILRRQIVNQQKIYAMFCVCKSSIL